MVADGLGGHGLLRVGSDVIVSPDLGSGNGYRGA